METFCSAVGVWEKLNGLMGEVGLRSKRHMATSLVAMMMLLFMLACAREPMKPLDLTVTPRDVAVEPSVGTVDMAPATTTVEVVPPTASPQRGSRLVTAPTAQIPTPKPTIAVEVLSPTASPQHSSRLVTAPTAQVPTPKPTIAVEVPSPTASPQRSSRPDATPTAQVPTPKPTIGVEEVASPTASPQRSSRPDATPIPQVPTPKPLEIQPEKTCSGDPTLIEVDPHPARLGERTTISVPTVSTWSTILDTLTDVAVVDSEGLTNEFYSIQTGYWPDELKPGIRSTSGWTFELFPTDGRTGRWWISITYRTIRGYKKELEGSFCVTR